MKSSVRLTGLSRRQVLATVAGSCVAWPHGRLAAHPSYGPVTPPVRPPELAVTTSQGHRVALRSLLKGHITAVQLMFVACTTTCPIQGAIFADAASHLASLSPQFRLLSISIDPQADTPLALKAWLQRLDAPPTRWTAAVPTVTDLDKLIDFLRGRASGIDMHTAQAFVFDRHARLVYRTVDMPTGGDLAALMRQVAQQA